MSPRATKPAAWEQTSVPKVRPAGPPPLGRGSALKDAKPMPATVVSDGARRAQHARCVEHVKVEGLATPVCILRGQDAALVIAEAVELAGGAS